MSQGLTAPLVEAILLDYRASLWEGSAIRWIGRVTSVLIGLAAGLAPSRTMSTSAFIVGSIGCILWYVSAVVNSRRSGWLRKTCTEAARSEDDTQLRDQEIRWRGEFLERSALARPFRRLLAMEPIFWEIGITLVCGITAFVPRGFVPVAAERLTPAEVTGRLTRLLGEYADSRGGCLVIGDSRLQSILGEERLPLGLLYFGPTRVRENKSVELAEPPDLAVIVIPKAARADPFRQSVTRGTPKGPRSVWLVESNRSAVTIYRAGTNQVDVFLPGRQITDTEILPKFSLEVNELFSVSERPRT